MLICALNQRRAGRKHSALKVNFNDDLATIFSKILLKLNKVLWPLLIEGNSIYQLASTSVGVSKPRTLIFKILDTYLLLYWGFLCTFHSLQRSKENFKIFAKASKESKENFINKNHIIILYFIVLVNKSCYTYSIKFVIFK